MNCQSTGLRRNGSANEWAWYCAYRSKVFRKKWVPFCYGVNRIVCKVYGTNVISVIRSSIIPQNVKTLRFDHRTPNCNVQFASAASVLPNFLEFCHLLNTQYATALFESYSLVHNKQQLGGGEASPVLPPSPPCFYDCSFGVLGNCSMTRECNVHKGLFNTQEAHRLFSRVASW